ncbi:hypothetical protein PGT21_023969 [Puccinia graminis f. sp. tritici]|uniref:Uncharacterized protein n=1 Tax=Puccinia graminis f. sp. tritici TaxID=56615 RepID=A0A5B0Q6T3_PUCGR|nr:hypothetical protein PGT21_023969 [Puccinia graminis f. sp. tritici]
MDVEIPFSDESEWRAAYSTTERTAEQRQLMGPKKQADQSPTSSQDDPANLTQVSPWARRALRDALLWRASRRDAGSLRDPPIERLS